MKWLLIVLGGGLGAVSRYVLSGWVSLHLDSHFPWGTLVVNLVGCFLIGFLFEWFSHTLIPPDVRNMLLVGFLGAFTTFSTFSLETLNLLQEGDWIMGILNIAVNVVIGVLLVLAGMWVFRGLIKLFQGVNV